ncbi:MAG: hypothetical protein JXA25_02570 [Anaerolineales bacterium]|nr:hypothetical protein [Anaerolineales bacterium]
MSKEEDEGEKKKVLGMIGFGVMGRNPALNICDYGFSMIGYYKNSNNVDS